MRIKIYGQDAVICAAGISDTANEDGKFTAEFYPVDLLLALRNTDKMLEGHPFLDLRPDNDDCRPTVAVESLRPGQVRKILRELIRGKFVALKVNCDRPPKVGKGRQWRRAQSGQPRRKEQREQVGFLFVKGSDYLSEGDIHWVNAICEDGKLYLERLQAVQAMGEFAIKLRQVVDQSAGKKRVKKRKLKRKERYWREILEGDTS